MTTIQCPSPEVLFSIVSGLDYGTTEIKINSASGINKEIPVRVFDMHLLETEELLITYCQSFDFRWNDRDWLQKNSGSYWHPLAENGFNPLGSFVVGGHVNPSGKCGIMVVKARNGSDALAAPVDYTPLFLKTGELMGIPFEYNGSLWIPEPPPGYKAMGLVAQAGIEKPELDAVVCVREDLVIEGDPGDLIHHSVLSVPFLWQANLASWKIEPLAKGPHENAYLSTGTFVSRVEDKIDPVKPSAHPVMNVLNVNLPVLAETPHQEYVPMLTNFDPPPDETFPVPTRPHLYRKIAGQ